MFSDLDQKYYSSGFVYTYIHTYIQTYIYIHTYTHTYISKSNYFAKLKDLCYLFLQVEACNLLC